MKYALCIAIGILIGYAIREYRGFDCPEVREQERTWSKRDTVKPDAMVKKQEIKPKGKKISSTTRKSESAGEVSRDSSDLFAYRDSIVNEEIEIFVTDTAKGEILTKEIAYRLKVPLKIIDSVFVERERITEKPVPQSGLFIGLEAGIGNLYRIAPEIEYLTKKGYAYSYNYDLINSIHSVGVKKRVF